MELSERLTSLMIKLKKASDKSDEKMNTFNRFTCFTGGLSLAIQGIRHRKLSLGISGCSLLVLGITGYSPLHLFGQLIDTKSGKPITLTSTMTVNKPRTSVYAFWRNFENLPSFMDHLASVKNLDERKSRWKAQWGDTILSWEAVLTQDVKNEMIAWRSLPSSEIKTSGEIRFKTAPGRRGTEVSLKLNYEPMAGPAGKAVAKLLNENLEQKITRDLKNFKHFIETGEKPVTSPQPSGRTEKKLSRAA